MAGNIGDRPGASSDVSVGTGGGLGASGDGASGDGASGDGAVDSSDESQRAGGDGAGGGRKGPRRASSQVSICAGDGLGA